MANNKIIGVVGRGPRVVHGVEVAVTELIWTDGGRSFKVRRVDDDADLTAEERFDEHPDDEQIAALLDHQPVELWVCPGCGAAIDAAHADLVADHVRDCDRVDGAGQRLGR